ncbi:hypothetical protein MUK42_16015 [Musa troglodytarum]|uniref:Uncharacterized protein n=1 Tax=Musa troglodytarum TaxID=320322 RepID=A0A9E7HNB7_9LILI|nr:hypothetical protein MUK42_16015 [Musa troglodytarum]
MWKVAYAPSRQLLSYLAGKKQVRTTRNVKTISLRKEDFPKKGKSRQVGSAKEPSNSVLK